MNDSVFKFTLDVNAFGEQKIMRVMKGDTKRKFEIMLTERGKPFIIPENCYAVFSGKKADGTTVFNDCTIEDGAVVYQFTAQTTAAAGVLKCEIVIYDEDETVLTSPKFIVIVDATITESDHIVIESINEVNALTALISETLELKNEVEEKLANGEFVGEQGPEGPQGPQGEQGVSIREISTSESEEDSGINYATIYLTDGRFFGWPVRNGSKGETGEAGLVWKGEWNPEEYYSAIKNGQFSRDVVSYNGSSYVVAVNSTAPVVGVVPEGDTTGKWALLASKGDKGERGPQGEADLGEYEKRIEEIETELESINPFKFTSAGANPNVLEIGNSVSSVVVSWALSKDPVSVNVNGEDATAAKSGSHTVNESVTATADPAFKEFAVSAANESGKTVSSKARINFYNGIYYGAGAIPSNEDLSFLTKVLSGSRGRTFTATANEGEYLWYILPARLGECTFKVGGFEGGFEDLGSVPFENEHGYSEDYRIYKSVNSGLGKTTVEVS